MEPINRSLHGVPVFINTGLLREPVRHVAKYQSPEVPHANQLRNLRVHGSDTSITGRTALFHSALHLLPFKYRETARMADLSGIAHDFSDQSRAISYIRQQSILLGRSALYPAHFLVIPDAEKKYMYNKRKLILITIT